MDDTEMNVKFDWGQDLLLYPDIAAQRIARKFGMKPDTAVVCLMFYNWNELILSADLELSVPEAVKRCGYLREEGSDNSKFETCELCYNMAMTRNLGCGHYYCHDCISGYCKTQVQGDNIKVCCPHTHCKNVLSHKDLNQYLDTDLSFQLSMSTLQNFVTSRPNMIWCPNFACCCLVYFKNWPKENKIKCPICNVKMEIKADGEARVCDDSTLIEWFENRNI